MATEDLNTYIEVDPESSLTKTSSRISASLMSNRESCYLYQDFGANYFDAIDLLFSFRISSASGNYGFAEMGFANNVADMYNWTGTYLEFFLAKYAWNNYQACLGPIANTYVTENTTYYCRMVRAAGSDTVTVYIYDDAGRTSLYDTLVATGLGTTKWRYFYPISSYNVDADGLFSGYYENFDFQRKSAGQVRFIGMGL